MRDSICIQPSEQNDFVIWIPDLDNCKSDTNIIWFLLASIHFAELECTSHFSCILRKKRSTDGIAVFQYLQVLNQLCDVIMEPLRDRVVTGLLQASLVCVLTAAWFSVFNCSNF